MLLTTVPSAVKPSSREDLQRSYTCTTKHILVTSVIRYIHWIFKNCPLCAVSMLICRLVEYLSSFCIHKCEMQCDAKNKAATNQIIQICFRRILILRFPNVENLLHFSFTDFPVNFIKQFVSCFFWCLKQMLFSKFVPYYCLHYIIARIFHIISGKNWYSMQTKSWWWAIQKICGYLISRFYSNRKNLMLTKYTCFTVHSLI